MVLAHQARSTPAAARSLDAPAEFIWSLDGYAALRRHGVLERCPTELIDGQIIWKLDFLDRPLRNAHDPAFDWTIEQYHAAVELSLFEGRRVQLIAGRIIEMPPMGVMHRRVMENAVDLFRNVFNHPKEHLVCTQVPLQIESAEPEPDVYVVRGGIEQRDRMKYRPDEIVLVAEVSDRTLAFDRSQKARLYAAAGLKDYWIFNVVDRTIEVHRRPVVHSDDARYEDVAVVDDRQTVTPLASGDMTLQVRDFFGDPQS